MKTIAACSLALVLLAGCGFGEGFRRGYSDNIVPAVVDSFTRKDAESLKDDLLAAIPKIPLPNPPKAGGDWGTELGVFIGGLAAYVTGSLAKGGYRAISKKKSEDV